MTPYAIETHNLHKVFGDKVAVQDLSLQVERGEVFGFLGPNGAGKTTSVKMLLGLISPTSGQGTVLGASLGDHRTRARIGFLPEHFRFHDWLSAVEFLTLHADLYHMERELARGRVAELLDLVGLTPHADKKLRAFSKGMLQRIGLAQALLNDPDLVILDEPTSGLDPVGRRLVRDIIRDLREKGTTVFLNSHFLSEVEITCDRVAFTKQGAVIRTSHLQALMDGELTVEVRAGNLRPEVLEGLDQWCRGVRTDGEYLNLTLEDESALPAINRYLVEQGVDVYALRPQQISLEDLFLQVVGTEGEL
ncbi:MAG: ABC transporter ATP-binding protein [Anaerolineales bacterium]|jgi:ABC-2 type transport system ATP-binding protein